MPLLHMPSLAYVIANGNKSAEASPTPGTETNGTSDELSNGVNGLAISGDVPDVPTAKTIAGAPEGEVVFDHKPSETELQEARDSLDTAPAAEGEGKKN